MAARTRIVVDWGTSNFRAYLFARDGSIARQHQAAAGILTVADRAFEAVLEREIGGWLNSDCDVFLSGMITSRNGWVETPYIEVPARLTALAAGAISRKGMRGSSLHFLPGVAARHPLPDVMRGEEIQIFGSITLEETASEEPATIILPGTHSKWARVEHGAIMAFRTFLTGELFALLKDHSIVGRLIPQEVQKEQQPFDQAAFVAGIHQAFAAASAGVLNDIFTARSGVLLDCFASSEIADRLSGIIIGHEIKSGLALFSSSEIRPTSEIRSNRVLCLVGERALCERYRLALNEAGHAAEIAPDHAAVEGFRRLCAMEGDSEG